MFESNLDLFKTMCVQPNLCNGQWWRVDNSPFPVLSGTVISGPPNHDDDAVVVATLEPPVGGEPIPIERALEMVLWLDAQQAELDRRDALLEEADESLEDCLDIQ